MAPDDVGNDVAEAMLRGLFRLKLATANHLFADPRYWASEGC